MHIYYLTFSPAQRSVSCWWIVHLTSFSILWPAFVHCRRVNIFNAKLPNFWHFWRRLEFKSCTWYIFWSGISASMHLCFIIGCWRHWHYGDVNISLNGNRPSGHSRMILLKQPTLIVLFMSVLAKSISFRSVLMLYWRTIPTKFAWIGYVK